MTTEPTQAELRLAAYRDAGTALGLLRGQRAARNAAEDAAFTKAFQEAAHAQLEVAGLCKCPPGESAQGLSEVEQLRAELDVARAETDQYRRWNDEARQYFAGSDAMAAGALARAGQLAGERTKLRRQLEEAQGERRTLEIKIHGAMDFINESSDATAVEIETAMRDIFGWAPKLSPAAVDTSMTAVASALEASAPDELTGQIGRSS